MLNDPELDKMIIYGLAGVCCVLLLAVIFLAVKRNVYYVDDEGREVPSPKQQAKMAARRSRRPKAEKAVEEAVPAVEAEEPVIEPVIEPAAEPVIEKVPVEEVTEITEPETAEPLIEMSADPFAEEPEEDADATKVMRFSIDPAQEEPAVEEPAAMEEEEVSEPELRMINVDEEPDEADSYFAEAPVMAAPKATGVTATVTVGGQSETHEIDKLPCLIGREQTSCNLVISEPAVSRRHARIYVNEDGLFIEDVSEHNGTYLNGTKLPSLGSAPLKEGDRISLGRAEIVVNRVLY